MDAVLSQSNAAALRKIALICLNCLLFAKHNASNLPETREQT